MKCKISLGIDTNENWYTIGASNFTNEEANTWVVEVAEWFPEKVYIKHYVVEISVEITNKGLIQ